MDLPFGGSKIAANLQESIARGQVIEHEDETLEPVPVPNGNSRYWGKVGNGPPHDCRFLKGFLYEKIYARSAVPHGCNACFKVR